MLFILPDFGSGSYNKSMRRLILALTLGLAITTSLYAAATRPVLKDIEVQVNGVGDPGEGRKNFKVLGCVACHRVLGDPDLPKPDNKIMAPVLGGLNKEHSLDELADAILSPSHSFAPGFGPTGESTSPMPLHTANMTLKQFFDILAYLKTSEELDAAWPKEQ